jgi:cyclase
MLTKRIIPCLDIKNGRTVKGINFVNIRDAGDPVELGKKYAAEGADELVFLDITATHEGRKTFAELAKRIAKNLDIPFTVGGGISSISDVETLLGSGADKVYGQWIVHTHGGRNPTNLELYSWALEVEQRGAGEILFTSMDHDGRKEGFALEALNKLHNTLKIPVIASGGGGSIEHFVDSFNIGNADAALAASIFHYNEIPVPQLKQKLSDAGIDVRIS